MDLYGTLKGIQVIDVAGKYGYSSPTAFNRAFQSIHGVAPSAVKSGGVAVKSFPPIKFMITIKGAKEIVTQWLPTSGYEYGNAPDVEVYLNPDPQNAQYEVWIPVIKK